MLLINSDYFIITNGHKNKGKNVAKRRKKEKKTYRYECTLTGEQFVLTTKVDNPDELMSVKAYYEMHPEEDDRPAVIKKKLGIETEE